MKISSFREYLKECAPVQFFKSAMGYTHVKNREQYEWWEFDELKSGSSLNMDGWEENISTEPSLIGVLNEADIQRQNSIVSAGSQYGVPESVAKKMIKTYIGYSTAYGAYFCQIGPYLNDSKDKYIESARGRFSYYIKKKRKVTSSSLMQTAQGAISKFIKNYGSLVELEPSDYSYTMRVMDSPREYKRQSHTVYRQINSIDMEDPELVEFLEKSAIEGKQSTLQLNGKGCLKILNSILGPWFTQEIQQIVAKTGKSQEDIINEMLLSPKKAMNLYNQVYMAWFKAYQEKDPAALASGKPPEYRLCSAHSGSQVTETIGQPQYKKIMQKDEMGNSVEVDTLVAYKNTKTLQAFYKIKAEIMHIISQQRIANPSFAKGENVDEDTEIIAQKLNENPTRIKSVNKTMKSQQQLQKQIEQMTELQRAGQDDGFMDERILNAIKELRKLNVATWTSSDVESVLSKFNPEDFENPEESKIKSISLVDEVVLKSGYDNLQTAFHMAKIYFAGKKIDGDTEYRIGSQNTIVFDPPEDFINYTSDDVMKYYNAKVAGEPIPDEVAPEPVIEDATPEEIAEDIGEAVREDAMDIPEEAPEDAPEDDEKAKELEDLLGRSVVNLIRISEDLDKNGKYDAAEEVHKIIRKYRGRV